MVVKNVKKPKTDIIVHDLGDGYNLPSGQTIDLTKVFDRKEIEASSGLRSAINEGWVEVIGVNYFVEETKNKNSKKIKKATTKVKVITDVPKPVAKKKEKPIVKQEVNVDNLVDETIKQLDKKVEKPVIVEPKKDVKTEVKKTDTVQIKKIKVDDLEWNDIRKLAKEHNISARQSKVKIVEALKDKGITSIEEK